MGFATMGLPCVDAASVALADQAAYMSGRGGGMGLASQIPPAKAAALASRRVVFEN